MDYFRGLGFPLSKYQNPFDLYMRVIAQSEGSTLFEDAYNKEGGQACQVLQSILDQTHSGIKSKQLI